MLKCEAREFLLSYSLNLCLSHSFILRDSTHSSVTNSSLTIRARNTGPLQKDGETDNGSSTRSLSSKTVAKDSFDHVLDRIHDYKYEDLTRYRELKTKGTLTDVKFRVRYSIRKDLHKSSKGTVYSSSSSSPTSSSSSTSTSKTDDEEDTKRIVIPSSITRSSSSSSSKLKESVVMASSTPSRPSCIVDWHIRSFFGGL